MIDAAKIFRKYDDTEFGKFDRIESPQHPRPDVCAFLLLHTLCPSTKGMISASDHDVVYLSVGAKDLNETATEEDIITILRCGVFTSTEYEDTLSMFV